MSSEVCEGHHIVLCQIERLCEARMTDLTCMPTQSSIERLSRGSTYSGSTLDSRPSGLQDGLISSSSELDSGPDYFSS